LKFLLRLPLFVLFMMAGALAMLIPAAFALAEDQHRIAQSFLYSAILFATLAALIGLATYGHQPRRVARAQLLTLIGALAGLPLMLAVPMVEALEEVSFFDIYFEMVSSVTTTGATLFEAEELARPFHLWRALVGWFGGFLMLLSAIAILAPLNLGGFEVLRPVISETAPAPHVVGELEGISHPTRRVLRYAAILFPLYLGATLVLWIGLMFLGIAPFFAVCAAMSTLATSGILPVGDLAEANTGLIGEMLIFVFLIVATSRQTLSNDLGRSFIDRLALDREVRIAFVFIVMVPLFLFLRHFLGAFEFDDETNLPAAAQALWGGIFTVMSFITTTGFVSEDWGTARMWSGVPTPGLVLAGLAIIGGGVATTAGGVKLLRVYVLYKHGLREMERLVHPNSIGSAGYLGRQVRRDGALMAWIFFMLFAISIAVIIIALALTGLGFEEAVIFAISALSTTGPLANVAIEGADSYLALGTAAKSVLMAAMVLGRLETLAIVALFNPDFWRR
jgi:trk system potassium uptake protein TrkH